LRDAVSLPAIIIGFMIWRRVQRGVAGHKSTFFAGAVGLASHFVLPHR
jgi:hypothetical protein